MLKVISLKKLMLCTGCLLGAALLLWGAVFGLQNMHHAFFARDFTPEEAEMSSTEGPKVDWHLKVDLDAHTLEVWHGGECIKTYPVSGGARENPSPIGTFKVVDKGNWGEGFGGAWLGINVPWGKYGIHGTVEPWFVGKSNASHGCIRMKNQDVRELYKIVPYGAWVTIKHDNPPFRLMRNGDVGSDVQKVQLMLEDLGYQPGGTDGRFGSYLERTVRQFQKDQQIYASGKVDEETYARLKSCVDAIGQEAPE